MSEDTKKCPMCGEDILAIAKKCKHCGEMLEDTKQSKPDNYLPGWVAPVVIIGLLVVIFYAFSWIGSSSTPGNTTNTTNTTTSNTYKPVTAPPVKNLPAPVQSAEPSAKKLYDLYKVINKDDPSWYIEEFIDGKILSTCKVGGKYDAYYGWIITRNTLSSSSSNDDKLYVFVTDLGATVRGAFRGEKYLSALHNMMRNNGCEPPQ